ncbi:hypothetical protein CEE63_08120 [Stenotrophomonas maltophilia]|uniref:Uncharacterized protein n=1 Tax=Stenotrophomonas maltophilia TaxID=40324 RepID=A0A2D0ALB4_STEMA|nr:hypothetical protein CEE63_08120 [Stenotrophomonas maltophilia]
MLFVQFSKYSISIEIHPRMAWIHDRSQDSVEGGVGPVAGVSAAWMPRPSPHGRVYGVSRHRIHPAIPQETSFCRCRCLKPPQVQGAALPTPPTGSRRPEQVPYAAIR